MPPKTSHSPPVKVQFGKDSWAYYAVTPRRRALVFLHGFKGEARRTWSQFDHLIYMDRAFEEFDCFFIGYDRLYASLISSSKRFYGFLRYLFASGADVGKRLGLIDNRELPYAEVVVVAHSMGSVVVRKALLEADDDGEPWVRQVSIVLYAPAHLGARVVRYISTFLDMTMLRAMVPLVQYKCHPLDELQPGSPLLTALAEDVAAKLKADSTKTFLVARRVIPAHDDDVVEGRDKRFCSDPKSEWIEETHESMSKPSGIKSEPMHQLLEALRGKHG